MGRCANPPAVETCFCETRAVLSGRKRVQERQDVRFMPMMWVSLARRLLLHPIPARSGPTSSRDKASVLWGDPNKRPDSAPNATSAPRGDGGQASCLLRSLSALFFPLALCSSVGRVAETKKQLLNPEGGRSRKGASLFSPFPRAGWLLRCLSQGWLLLPHPYPPQHPCFCCESRLTLEFELTARAASWEYFKNETKLSTV